MNPAPRVMPVIRAEWSEDRESYLLTMPDGTAVIARDQDEARWIVARDATGASLRFSDHTDALALRVRQDREASPRLVPDLTHPERDRVRARSASTSTPDVEDPAGGSTGIPVGSPAHHMPSQASSRPRVGASGEDLATART